MVGILRIVAQAPRQSGSQAEILDLGRAREKEETTGREGHNTTDT